MDVRTLCYFVGEQTITLAEKCFWIKPEGIMLTLQNEDSLIEHIHKCNNNFHLAIKQYTHTVQPYTS